jgi:hypothetical protein
VNMLQNRASALPSANHPLRVPVAMHCPFDLPCRPDGDRFWFH